MIETFKRLCTGYLKLTQYISWMANNFSALQTHKNKPLQTQCLSKEHAVLFKLQLFIYILLNHSIVKKQKSVSFRLCGMSIWMERGWRYEVSLRAWGSNDLIKFYWQALCNTYQWLNICKTLWFKIKMNYNRNMKFGYFLTAHLTGGICHTETLPLLVRQRHKSFSPHLPVNIVCNMEKG